MKKVMTVIGARPQFIKEAPVSKALRHYFQEIIVHTGQHYDANMSRIFFDDMAIPRPDYELSTGSGSHARMTGEMMVRLEEVILKENPDYVVVFGDTNSTIAGALTAVKMHIPVGHIEAGLRSFNRIMPEEINRIVTDKISTQLFCPTQTAINLLHREGISNGVFLAGDVMFDAMRQFLPVAQRQSQIKRHLALDSDRYHLLTIHRAENSNNLDRLKSIFKGLAVSEIPIIFPRHPRMKTVLAEPELAEIVASMKQLRIIEPVGFLDMVSLEHAAEKILTDSGGVQKEAFFLQKPCITLRTETEWTETVIDGYNIVVGTNSKHIADAIINFIPDHQPGSYFGDGHAAEKIAEIIREYLQ